MSKLKFWLPASLTVVALALGCAGCTKEAKKKRYFAHAEQDFRAERYDRAEVEYLAVLSIPPPSTEALSGLGLVYSAEGKMQQAYAILRRTVELQPANQELRKRLGLICLSLGRSADAREVALWLLEKQPQDAAALLLLAESIQTTNQANEVQQRLEALPSTARDTADYHLARGTVLVTQQQMEQAEVEFKTAIAREPKSSKAYSVLANLFLIRNDPQQAEGALKTAASLAPLRSTERLRYAEWEFRNGATEAAKDQVEEITRKAPDYVPAWMFLARMAFTQHRVQDCQRLLKTTLVKDPVNLDALLLSGNLLLSGGETTNAIAHFEKMAQIYPDFPPVTYGLALAQLRFGEVGKALASLNKSLASDPNFADALLLLANLDISKGDASSAISILTRLLSQQPQIAQAHLLLASAYLAKKSPDEALGVYHHMAELFPKSPEVPLVTGIVLAQQKQKEAAQRAFEESLRLSPDFLPAVEQLVDLDIADKRFEDATRRVEAQMQKNPAVAEPWLLMAKIHVARATKPDTGEAKDNPGSAPTTFQIAETPEAKVETDKAESALRKAIELNPDLRTAYLLLAQLYVASHRRQQALDQLTGFVAKTNDVVALMQMGMIHEELTNYVAAREDYERLLKVNPRFSIALNNLAYLYSARFGQLDRAYQMAAEARELMPYDPATADTLGWILYQRREYTRALGLIQESVMKLPNEPEIQFHLGMTYYMMGDERAAQPALEQAAAGGRDFPGQQEARQRLALLAINVETAGPADMSKLHNILVKAPDDPVALDRLAGIQSRKGDFEKAYVTYQTALKAHPQNTELIVKLAGLCFEHLNDPGRALELAKQAHSLDPQDAVASRLLGRLTYHNGNYRWASSLLEEADRKLPEDPSASYDLAWSYYNLGRVGEAESKMVTVARHGDTFAKHADAARFLTMVAALNDPAKGQASAPQVRTILGQDPGYVPALMVSASLLEGQGDFQGAAAIYTDIIVRNQLFTPATRNLAILYTDHLGNDAKAYELAVKAREAFPEDAKLARTLGILCYRRADYARTIQLLDGEGLKSTADAELLYYLGMAYYQLKEPREGKAALQRALELKLNAQLAPEATRALNEMN